MKEIVYNINIHRPTKANESYKVDSWTVLMRETLLTHPKGYQITFIKTISWTSYYRL